MKHLNYLSLISRTEFRAFCLILLSWLPGSQAGAQETNVELTDSQYVPLTATRIQYPIISNPQNSRLTISTPYGQPEAASNDQYTTTGQILSTASGKDIYFNQTLPSRTDVVINGQAAGGLSGRNNGSPDPIRMVPPSWNYEFDVGQNSRLSDFSRSANPTISVNSGDTSWPNDTAHPSTSNNPDKTPASDVRQVPPSWGSEWDIGQNSRTTDYSTPADPAVSTGSGNTTWPSDTAQPGDTGQPNDTTHPGEWNSADQTPLSELADPGISVETHDDGCPKSHPNPDHAHDSGASDISMLTEQQALSHFRSTSRLHGAAFYQTHGLAQEQNLQQSFMGQLSGNIQAYQPPMNYPGPIRKEPLSLRQEAILAAGGEDAYIRRLIELRERYNLDWLTSDDVHRMIIDPRLIYEWFNKDNFEDDDTDTDNAPDSDDEDDLDENYLGDNATSESESDEFAVDDDSQSGGTDEEPEETDAPLSYYEQQAQAYLDGAKKSREYASNYRDQAAASRASAEAASERAAAAKTEENRAWWERHAQSRLAHAELLEDMASQLENSATRDEQRAEDPAQAGSADNSMIDDLSDGPGPSQGQESLVSDTAGQNSTATVNDTGSQTLARTIVPRWVLRDPDSPYLRDPVAKIGIPPRIIKDRRGRVVGTHDGDRLTLTIPIGTSEWYEEWPYGYLRRERPDEYRKVIEGLQMPGQELYTFTGPDGLPIYHLAENIVKVEISADDPRVADIEQLALDVANGEFNWGEFAWALTQAGLDGHPAFTALDDELTDIYAGQPAMEHAGNYVNGTDAERDDLNMLLMAAEPNGVTMGRQPLPVGPRGSRSGRGSARHRSAADSDATPRRGTTSDDATPSRTTGNNAVSHSGTPYTPCLDRRPMTASRDPIGQQPKLQGVDAVKAAEVRGVLNQIRRTDLTRDTDCWGGSLHLSKLAGRGSATEGNATSPLTRMDHTMYRVGSGSSMEYIDTRPGMWRKHFADNPKIRANLEQEFPGLPTRLEQGAVLTGEEFLRFQGNRPVPRSPMFDQNPIPSGG